MGKALYTSDIQYQFKRSSDNKSLSVTINNFGVALMAGSSAVAVATRVLPLTIPVVDAGKGATVDIAAQGQVVCPDGAACNAVVWLNGQTMVLTFAAGKATAKFSLVGADVYQATIILMAERDATRNQIAASIKIDTLDFAITPPTPSGGSK